MPFDREGTLRKAEKLLRQGRIDLAVTEYLAVIEDQPTDWNTSNTLGDLYFRVGQVDKAVAEYSKIADHLASEGFFPKAVALYRKILKIKPDDERAMWHLGGIAAQQGLLVDARANFLTLAERRRARGDKRGEAEVRLRLGDLEGADLETCIAGARARVELGEAKAAVERLKLVAADLQEKGKETDALRLLTEAAQIDPEDLGLRRSLVQVYAARSDFEAASQFATSAEELRGVAEELFRQSREDEGINVLRSAVDADPSDSGIRAQLAQLLATRGDIEGARELLTPEVAGSNPDLLWALAELELRGGRIIEGTAVVQRLLAEDPSCRDRLIALSCSVAEMNPDAGYESIEVAASDAIVADDWGSAAGALHAFVSRVPNHVPALMRLVEICVDGGLEEAMHIAQAQLADAYLIVGAGLEARVIAEDLVARAPWDPANIERFRRALTLLGETDIDALIAERLSGENPFRGPDFFWPAEPPAPEPTHVPVPAPEPKPPATARSPEVDLSDALHGLRKGNAGRPQSSKIVVPVEDVLNGMRDEVVHDASPETAEQHISLAGTYMEMGMQAEALHALEVAARSPRHRFRAAAMLAKEHVEAGDAVRAIEWYERAAEAPSPSPEALHALLYDLASVLEAQGESARALAVLLELQSEAADYRDVSARLEHLKVQMGR
ncbi:MAG TPA: tetratricopeptide repeat protein [Vicinamibacterales bacterium]|nr:tetratricopeptide repeat protein [Vicinamibacterales bacterium]